MELIKLICKFLDIITNPLIIVVAIIELVFMIQSIRILRGFKEGIKELNGIKERKSSRFTKKIKNKLFKTVKPELNSEKDWDEFDLFRKDYQEKGFWYSAFSQTIQIFTLLGILGTVAGLYLAMGNIQDMYEGVELALSSTVLGILCAVIYKIADTIIVSFFINYIEEGISRYQENYKVESEEAEILVAPKKDI